MNELAWEGTMKDIIRDELGALWFISGIGRSILRSPGPP